MENAEIGVGKVDFKSMPIYEEYPFEVEGVVRKSYVTREDEELAALKDTGEMFVFKKLPKTKTVRHDSLVYTKFFRNAAAIMSNLSVPAANMFFLICSKLEVNQTFICISEDDFIKHSGYKPTSKRLYYTAIVDLIRANIIKKKSGFSRCYWINANVIFNGDRTKIL